MMKMSSRAQLAAVDLGSNSFRLIIGRIESSPVGDQILPLDQLKETVRLAAGLNESGLLSESAQERALSTLQRFGERLRAFHPDRVRAVATNTFRVARNATEFLGRARQALGFPIEVIAGREEARLIYLGAAHSLPVDDQARLVIDIGGGSTECIVGTNYESGLLESIPLGCVNLTQRFFPEGVVDRQRYQQAKLMCRDAISPLSARYRSAGWRSAIGTSGSAKAIWAIVQADFGEDALSAERLAELEAILLRAGHVDRVKLEGLKADRRPVIAGGLAMMSALFEEFGIDSLSYCDGALREGVLYDLLGRSSGEDMRAVTVAQMRRRHQLDAAHGDALAALATTLYDQISQNGEAQQDAADIQARRQQLQWAAQLCEIGLSIGHADFHKHGAYILAHCDMPGFSEAEQQDLALLVLGQSGGLTKMQARVIDTHDWLRMLCLRLALIFHRRRDGILAPDMRLRMKPTGARLDLGQAWLEDHPLTRQSLEQEVAEWNRAGPWSLTLRLN
jgi:exopolyphosphatase/guanosine-5'-triphosphate,3'-diphosphate pyrophosphatase